MLVWYYLCTFVTNSYISNLISLILHWLRWYMGIAFISYWLYCFFGWIQYLWLLIFEIFIVFVYFWSSGFKAVFTVNCCKPRITCVYLKETMFLGYIVLQLFCTLLLLLLLFASFQLLVYLLIMWTGFKAVLPKSRPQFGSLLFFPCIHIHIHIHTPCSLVFLKLYHRTLTGELYLYLTSVHSWPVLVCTLPLNSKEQIFNTFLAFHKTRKFTAVFTAAASCPYPHTHEFSPHYTHSISFSIYE